MIAIFEARNREDLSLIRTNRNFHSNFKVLIFDRYGKSILACEELSH